MQRVHVTNPTPAPLPLQSKHIPVGPCEVGPAWLFPLSLFPFRGDPGFSSLWLLPRSFTPSLGSPQARLGEGDVGTGQSWSSPVPHACPCPCSAPAPLERSEPPRTPSHPAPSSWWQFCCSQPFPLNPNNKNSLTALSQAPRTPLQPQPQAATTASHSAAAQKGASSNISVPVLLWIDPINIPDALPKLHPQPSSTTTTTEP